MVKDGKLWIGSGGDGLFVYSKNFDGFTKKNTKSGLSSDLIKLIDDILFVSTQLGLNYLLNGNII